MTKHLHFTKYNSFAKGSCFLLNFGFGNDFIIRDNCDSNKSSSNLGVSYDPPNGVNQGTNEARTYLAGSENFTVREIEIFSVDFL